MIDDTLAEVDLSLLADEPSPAEALDNFRTFVMEYQRQQAQERVVYLPEVDPTVCDDCGGVTPVSYRSHYPGAMKPTPALCIKCCACVKSCPQGPGASGARLPPCCRLNFCPAQIAPTDYLTRHPMESVVFEKLYGRAGADHASCCCSATSRKPW